jgi:hypothetical protein
VVEVVVVRFLLNFYYEQDDIFERACRLRDRMGKMQCRGFERLNYWFWSFGLEMTGGLRKQTRKVWSEKTDLPLELHFPTSPSDLPQ